MLNLLYETRVSLTEMAQKRDVSVSTIWRWVTRGVKGVRLESYTAGGRRFTTEEAFARFTEATSRATGAIQQQAHRRSSRRREKDINDSTKYSESQNF